VEEEVFEGYFKKANCFAFLKTQALEESECLWHHDGGKRNPSLSSMNVANRG